MSTSTSTPPTPAFEPRVLRRFLNQVLDLSAGPLEIRVIGAYYTGPNNEKIRPHSKFGTTLAGWFSDRESLISAAMHLDGISANLLYNPADRALLSRVSNELQKCRETTKNEDITMLRWWFVDIDAGQKSGISATQEEHERAVRLRDRILAEHPDLAASALWGRSGNGCWILVRLADYPVDKEHRTLVQMATRSLVSRYYDDPAHVDGVTFPPAKTGSLPGTAKCKGKPSVERPWRSVTYDGLCGALLPLLPDVYPQPDDDPRPEPFDLAAWLEKFPPIAVEPTVPAPAGQAAQATVPAGQWPLDVKLRRARAYIAPIDGAIEGRGGHNQTFDVACALVKGFALPLEHARAILGEWNVKCQPIWEPHDLDHKIQSADEKEDERARGYLLTGDPGGGDGARSAVDGSPMSFEFSDFGNAERLLHRYGREIRYCEAHGGWMHFDGARWKSATSKQVERLSSTIPELIRAEIPPGANSETIEAYATWAIRSASTEKMVAATKQASWHRAIEPTDLDVDPWLLNLENGTIDLRTGHFRPHDPADLITKVAPVRYDPNAICPLWDKTILEILGDDPEIVDFIQRAFGYAVTGVIRDHIMLICYGSGSNGKTMMFNSIKNVLGDYAIDLDSGVLIQQAHSQHPTGLTDLEGRRFVVAEESEDSDKLAEALVKRLTGGNTIRARKMHKDFYEFKPTHHLFLATNHRPEIKNMDFAIWRRLRAVPFEQTFSNKLPGARKADDQLEEKLKLELPGILNWLLRGCWNWQTRGLSEPEAIQKATASYREEQDVLGAFLDERCVAEEGSRIEFKFLYQEYKAWCEAENVVAWSKKKIGSKLGDRGFAWKKLNSTTWRYGVRLKTEQERYPREEAEQTKMAFTQVPTVGAEEPAF